MNECGALFNPETGVFEKTEPEVFVEKYIEYKWRFPIVEQVFSKLVSSELVSVQPMSAPTGIFTYLDYTYNAEFNPREAIMNRYAQFTVNPDYYEVINITNINPA